jgi:hypothetical protein
MKKQKTKNKKKKTLGALGKKTLPWGAFLDRIPISFKME